MKHLFVGGPWDGQMHDLAAEFGITDAMRGAIQIPTSKPDDAINTLGATAVYYPRKYRWVTETGRGVQVEVMSASMSNPLGGSILAHLFRLAGLDVIWQHDPNDPG